MSRVERRGFFVGWSNSKESIAAGLEVSGAFKFKFKSKCKYTLARGQRATAMVLAKML